MSFTWIRLSALRRPKASRPGRPASVDATTPGNAGRGRVGASALSRRRMGQCTAAWLGAWLIGVSHAQYVGPTHLGLRTVKQVTEQGRDDEPVRLRGQLVSHEGGDRYTFADATGRVAVEIDAHLFPAGQPIDDRQWVDITGEVDRSFSGVKVDVKTMTLVQAPRPGAAAASAPLQTSATRR